VCWPVPPRATAVPTHRSGSLTHLGGGTSRPFPFTAALLGRTMTSRFQASSVATYGFIRTREKDMSGRNNQPPRPGPAVTAIFFLMLGVGVVWSPARSQT
jgi:hypothetical protein